MSPQMAGLEDQPVAMADCRHAVEIEKHAGSFKSLGDQVSGVVIYLLRKRVNFGDMSWCIANALRSFPQRCANSTLSLRKLNWETVARHGVIG